MKTVLRLDACAKINWALAVTGVREDGYHTLDMLMQRVSLCDTLYAAPAGELSLRVIGPPVPGAAPRPAGTPPPRPLHPPETLSPP